jgi:two-component system response regulator FlrC
MNDVARVLVVEDDDTLREALCDTITFGGYQAVAAGDGVEALTHMERESVDMVISDVQMDRMDGHRLLREVRSRQPSLPFVMITAHGSVRDAVAAMRDGATDYLLKPFEAQVLLDMVARMEPVRAAGDFIAEDPASRRLYALAERVADSDATILIAGESGSGKEVLARYLHTRSGRADAPFLAINCAAIPENMLESMLFGYEKGAYTGAYQSRAGKFEQANGGTLLLDEISEMELGLQAKLLRVLQEREVERLGGQRVIPLDVRVLATTNRRLDEAVRDGRFREDLYYRLNVLPLVCRRCANAPLTYCPWRGVSSPSTPGIGSCGWATTRSRRCWATAGAAMCANCRTVSSAPRSSPVDRRSAPPTWYSRTNWTAWQRRWCRRHRRWRATCASVSRS